MKTSLAGIIFLLTLDLFIGSMTGAHELSGKVAVEGRFFFEDPRLSEQKRTDVSVAFQPEYYHEWENGASVTVVPFARLDSADSRRTHFDVRELNLLWVSDNWELRLGFGKVFWGVTEFVHLVDIINQTDLVEDIDGEEKLGQPMAHLAVPRDWGTIDLFLLPLFRKRTFPGPEGRLGPSPVVETDKAAYESGAEESHFDVALRYSHSMGGWDLGAYHFMGTGREPTLLLNFNENGRPSLAPFYEQISQTGLDLQRVEGNWLLKLEALYRTGQGDDFFASVSGFEYTFVNMAQTGIDLGIIGEWAFDERGDASTTAFQNDAIFGLRLALNDAAGSQLLGGYVQDLENGSRGLSVEGSRRFGNNWRLSIELRSFFNQSEGDVLFSLRDDDFFQLELTYYF